MSGSISVFRKNAIPKILSTGRPRFTLFLVTDREVEIGRRIRSFREEKHISRTRFALLLGISPERLASYETGKAPLRYSLAREMARHFHLNPLWLATGAGSAVLFEDYDDSGFIDRVGERALFSEVFDTHLYGRTDLQLANVQNAAQSALNNLNRLRESLLSPDARGRLSAETVERLIFALALIQEDLQRWQNERLTDIRYTVTLPPMGSKLSTLLKEVQSLSSAYGKKADLARFLGVPFSRVSEWLGGVHEPGAEIALRLQDWVWLEKRKEKTPASATNTRKGEQTRKGNDEKSETGPPKRKR